MTITEARTIIDKASAVGRIHPVEANRRHIALHRIRCEAGSWESKRRRYATWVDDIRA